MSNSEWKGITDAGIQGAIQAAIDKVNEDNSENWIRNELSDISDVLHLRFEEDARVWVMYSPVNESYIEYYGMDAIGWTTKVPRYQFFETYEDLVNVAELSEDIRTLFDDVGNEVYAIECYIRMGEESPTLELVPVATTSYPVIFEGKLNET